jgi:hypothetical protein
MLNAKSMFALMLAALWMCCAQHGVAAAEETRADHNGALEGTYRSLLDEAQQSGRSTEAACELAEKARQAMERGDVGAYRERMASAIKALRRDRAETDERSPREVGAKGQEAVGELRDRGQKRTGTVSKRMPRGSGAPDGPVRYADSPFGIHAGATGEWVTDPRGEAIDIGAHWDIMVFVWGQIQPDLSEDSYRWSALTRGGEPSCDERVRVADPEGFVVATLQANPYQLPKSYLPVDREKYGAFVQAVVERYDGDGIQDMPGLTRPIRHWIVDNEPVDRRTDYPELMRLTHEAVKTADAGAKVIVGAALGPDADLNIHKGYLKALNGKHMDIFDIHWFGDAKGDYRRVGRHIEDFRQALEQYGFGRGLPVWMTEMATYSGKPWQPPGEKDLPFQSEEMEASDILKRYVYGLSIGVKKMFLVKLFEGFDGTGGYFDHTGLLYDGSGDKDDKGFGVKKLAYHTYKLMTDKLEGSDWSRVRTIDLGVANTYACEFVRPATGKHTYVAWWDRFDEAANAAGESLVVSLRLGSEWATVTSAVTEQNGQRIARRVPTVGGVLRLELTAVPLFVEE